MSYTALIDCDNVSDYDVERIFQDLLVYDEDTGEYKLRTA